MANNGPNQNGSMFFITLTDEDLPVFVKKHTIFGVVAEGLEVLNKINTVFVNKDFRPLQNIRIKHTLIIEDPFEGKDSDFNLQPLKVPSRSPTPERIIKTN